jgi:hypothetical protein
VRGTVFSVVAAVCVSVIAAFGAVTAAASSESVHITVKPSSGPPTTHFRVSFKAPASSEPSSTSSRYQLRVSGPTRKGCESSVTHPLSSVHAGQQVHVTLAPGAPAHVWCQGKFSGQLQEIVVPVCSPARACPQFIAIVTVGSFSFRVKSRAAARG